MLVGKTGYMFKTAFLALLFVVQGLTSAIANTLEDITYSTLPGDQVQVVLTTSEPMGVPESFTTDNPARIAIDLPNTPSALKSKTKTLGASVARSVTAIEAGDKTRVVINLLDSAPYDITTEGNRIIVAINGSGGAAKSSAGSAPAPAMSSQSRNGHSITSVDFRRGTEGEARVEIVLSDPNVVIDMRQQGESVVLDFMETSLPADQARTLDVTDFATPVVSIETRPRSGNVRMNVLTAGEFEHLAYQTDNLYTLELRPLSKQEKAARQKENLVYVGERLSLNFQDIEVRSVLQLLADFTGLNMVVSDTVDGRITLRLKNVPWDQALDIILKTKGLSMRRNDNVILVAPTEELAAREKLELESQQQIEELAPLRSELVQVNYARAASLAELLKSEENRLLSERGNVTVDDRTNTLLLQDTAAKLGEIRKLVDRLDIPVRQVLIESRIVIANDSFTRDLGVRFGFNRANAAGDVDTLVAGGTPGHIDGTQGIAPGIGSGDGGDSGAENLKVNLPAMLEGGRGGALNFLVAKAGSFLLQLELTAMQQEGEGEVISSPRVITSDQNTAIIKQGVEIPYQEATSSGATNVEFKEAVLMLEVKPHITPDDRIIMELKVNKDEPDFNRSILGVPPVDTRSLETTVLVDNGETVVLGGVFERKRSSGEEKIPFFGDIPVIGWAFKRELKEDANQELLIFVTPKILKETMALQ